MPVTDPLAEMYDIEGLDAISWWPPAVGWWIVSILVLFLTAIIVVFYRRKKSFERSWCSNTLKILSEMENNTSKQDTVATLSELIRRIAVHQYSRKTCAGLEGKKWIQWLKQHDPEHFDWETEAAWLIEAPYAPPGTSTIESEIKTAIQAIRKWVK